MALATLLLLGSASPLLAQELLSSPQRLLDAQNQPIDGAVSISGEYALVHNHILKREGTWWNYQTTLIPDDGGEPKGFNGQYVALAGEYAILANSYTNTAYIFKRGAGEEWTQQTTLRCPENTPNSWFGDGVAISERYAFVGDIASETVYIYRRQGDNWSFDISLTPETGDHSRSGFGKSISVSEETLAIGADYANMVHIYSLDGNEWLLQATLQPEEPEGRLTRFGYSIELSGDRLIVGDFDHRGSIIGAAYLFERQDTQWIQRAKFLPEDGDDVDHFGRDVALSGDTLVIGANGHREVGAAYLYKWDGAQWTRQQELTPETAEFDNFGFSVDVEGESLYISQSGTWPSSPYAYAYALSADSYTISGRITTPEGAPVPGVVLQGFPGPDVMTNESGHYETTVVEGWQGRITPSKLRYRFDQEMRLYTPVSADQSGQDYTGVLSSSFSISGTITRFNGTPAEGIRLEGLPGTPVTDAQGHYQATVPAGWSGSVTPKAPGRPDATRLFSPATQNYADVGADLIQDYHFIGNIISGKIVDEQGNGLAGVMLEGAPGAPTTGEDGSYRVFLSYFHECLGPISTGMGCRFTPQKAGTVFTPVHREYNIFMMTGDVSGQNYTGASQMPLHNVTLNVDGTVYSGNQLRTSSFFDTSDFDWSSGQGQIQMMFRPGAAGEYSIQLSMDYLINRLMADSLSTTLPAGTPDRQLLGLSVEEDSLLSAEMGWSVRLADAEDFATLIFTIGHTMPEEGPYSRVSYLTDAGEIGDIYFSSQLEAVPEPGTFLLLSGGLLGLLAATRRMRRK